MSEMTTDASEAITTPETLAIGDLVQSKWSSEIFLVLDITKTIWLNREYKLFSLRHNEITKTEWSTWNHMVLLSRLESDNP
jgi:hypothetical protein